MTYLLINDYSKFKIALEEIKAYGCLRRVTHLAKLNDYRLESNQEKRERKKKFTNKRKFYHEASKENVNYTFLTYMIQITISLPYT